MKQALLIALIASLGASTAFAQRAVRVKPRVNNAARATTPSANKVGLKSSQTDAALTANLQALTKGQPLTAKESELTCNGSNGLFQLIQQHLSGSENLRFVQALSAINKNGVVIQSCQAGEPITQKEALVNLGKLVILVGDRILSNQGYANQKRTWVQAFKEVFPDLTDEESMNRIEKLSSAPCNLIKLS